MSIINDYMQLRTIESLNATTKLAKENKKLKEKLEKVRKYANQLEVFTHIKEDLLRIIEGAEDE